jgi:hypothetical protein
LGKKDQIGKTKSRRWFSRLLVLYAEALAGYDPGLRRAPEEAQLVPVIVAARQVGRQL